MRLFQRLFDTFRSGRLDRELDEEMRFHIDMRAEAYERQGLSREEARRRAFRRFGNTLHVKERTRDVRVLAWLDSVRQDASLGLRLSQGRQGKVGEAVGAAGIFDRHVVGRVEAVRFTSDLHLEARGVE